jgi:hypothetical protein
MATADVNECATNRGRGPCQQTCRNTPGSFQCACQQGYRLNRDGRTCGIVKKNSLEPSMAQRDS